MARLRLKLGACVFQSVLFLFGFASDWIGLDLHVDSAMKLIFSCRPKKGSNADLKNKLSLCIYERRLHCSANLNHSSAHRKVPS